MPFPITATTAANAASNSATRGQNAAPHRKNAAQRSRNDSPDRQRTTQRDNLTQRLINGWRREVKSNCGSFDFAFASLCSAFAPLRITVLWGNRHAWMKFRGKFRTRLRRLREYFEQGKAFAVAD